MYELMVAFDPTRAAPVSGGRNKDLNFGTVVVDSKTTGDDNLGGSGSIGRNLEC